MDTINTWFEYFEQLGPLKYIFGFILPFIENFIPILPIIAFVIFNVNAYGFWIGVLLAWLGIVTGSYIVFVIFRKFSNSKFMKKLKQRESVKRLIHFIDRNGIVPIFILLSFPFTPSSLINVVASISHIKSHYYIWALCISKLIMVSIVGFLGKDIRTFFTDPTRLIISIVVIIVVWIVGRKIEQHYMHASEE
ncbi:putative membrane protein YdjX (TVP38/TMEM64 family) [Staphylococcus auricularis]|uniref:TVP38/TMEM64 family protein n=2 Tax=Staphylococcus auricularis TaxID=29379 RepID=UPI0012464815|nr:TVP38/TMEM64 family protein [Staphylococcus auricularis]MBM0868777.1 TVP38/TMEM64 family protein [Staphylococcus auricularis]HJE01673.1 TVP38/TMEM64 family protein [Staphylococcus auricularis]